MGRTTDIKVLVTQPTTARVLRAAGVDGVEEGEEPFLAILRWRGAKAAQVLAYGLRIDAAKNVPEGEANGGQPYRAPNRVTPRWRVLTFEEMERLGDTQDGRDLTAAFLRAVDEGRVWERDRRLEPFGPKQVKWHYPRKRRASV